MLHLVQWHYKWFSLLFIEFFFLVYVISIFCLLLDRTMLFHHFSTTFYHFSTVVLTFDPCHVILHYSRGIFLLFDYNFIIFVLQLQLFPDAIVSYQNSNSDHVPVVLVMEIVIIKCQTREWPKGCARITVELLSYWAIELLIY